jgi:hypothetical protein
VAATVTKVHVAPSTRIIEAGAAVEVGIERDIPHHLVLEILLEGTRESVILVELDQ